MGQPKASRDLEAGYIDISLDRCHYWLDPQGKPTVAASAERQWCSSCGFGGKVGPESR
jgi:hypothetical protein